MSFPLVRTSCRFPINAGGLFALALGSSEALAHHPMAGLTPTSSWHGLLSGLAHPVFGLDHLAFTVGLAVLCASHAKARAIASLFVVAVLTGVALHVRGIGFPGPETLVSGTLLLASVALLIARPNPSTLVLAAFAALGVIHGYALGETVAGAEPTPIAAYLVGLAATQFALMFGIMALVGSLVRPGQRPVLARVAGALTLCIGAAMLYATQTSVA